MEHLRMLALYNRLANEKLFESCAALEDAEYRKERKGSFGSIAAILNHILLGDRIWMSRFEGRGGHTPPLNTTLFEGFNELRAARIAMDAQIESFFEDLDPVLFGKRLRYVNSRGESSETRFELAAAHMFNHQTHHRGQVHVMLSQTAVPPPPLDMHSLVRI